MKRWHHPTCVSLTTPILYVDYIFHLHSDLTRSCVIAVYCSELLHQGTTLQYIIHRLVAISIS